MIDREWVTIIDRDAPAERYLFDVTFLLSRYQCLYGRGCPGTGSTPSADLGCCRFGAHYVEPADRARVEAAAARLSPADFQHHAEARRGGVSVDLPGGEARTRIVDGACVFLNREGWPGGHGCALHRAALERGAEPLEDKPEVCWMVPLRREVREEVGDDGQPQVVTTITSFDRGAWGEGGADFGWWCTEAPEAYGADAPLYETMAAELTAMSSPAVYAELAAYLADRRAGPRHPRPLQLLPVVQQRSRGR